jgi:large repetitive protein
MSPVRVAFGIRLVVFSFFLVIWCFPALGQGTKIRPESEVAETDRDQPRQREQWFMHGRLIPGESAAALRYRAHRQKMQLRAEQAARMNTAITTASTTAIGIWTPLGPAPLASDATGFGQQDYGWVSGRATAVAVDPADATGNTVYSGGAYGGVWKSTNAGPLSPNPFTVSWSPLIDNQATLAVGSIAVQPGNTDPTKSVILVGTGETNSSMDSYYGLGILRSADAGNTWALITQDSSGTHPFAGMGFSKIAFSTANPSLVVAAAAGASQGVIDGLENPVSANRGIYYSNNGGLSWNYANISDVGTAIQPNSATSVIYNAAAGKFFAAIRFHGFYSSTDGVNWTRLATQPGGLSTFACPTTPASQGCPIYRGEFAVTPGRNEMYVWYVDENENDQGIWQTTDGGNTWIQLDDSGITNCGDFSGGCGTAQGSYNLELAAVPNGLTATDLYAGAINIYKCTVSSLSPVCSGTGQGTFLNLTHVYGCAPNFGSIAHVHPDQHDLDFIVANSRAILYFANDGGIYRALDGYSGLTTGDCGGTNQFDSLNQTLGSMSQFVSFSQHPSDLNTILGGTQDNGSPATTSAATSTSWFNVNSGDGGYTAINPDNPTEWFTANTNVSIQKCELAGNCHAQDFNNGLVCQMPLWAATRGRFIRLTFWIHKILER